jgi:hypothetical protein
MVTSALVTPGTARSARSTAAAHAPHVMPVTTNAALSWPAVPSSAASKPMSSTAATRASGVTRLRW